MFHIQYQQWQGSGQPRAWKRWKGPFATKSLANAQLKKEREIWPNDNFRVVMLEERAV